ncbi:MAG: alpha-ketoacid dehydrogenase subunit beta [Actinomycetota bacterium]|nr:alpha-ketoacid dehydrogenase subunit beta [Actinomycetota bacterium]
MNFRKAVAEALAREMRRDDSVVVLGEDVAEAGGVWRTTQGLLDEFGPGRVWDTPISEQAIVGAAIGAAMTGLRPVAEIMYADFLGVCWDQIANQAAKLRYMTGGQLAVPLVIRTVNGGGVGKGAQHSQSLENWAMAVPGLKVAVPSTPSDLVGLMTSAIRSDDPVMVFEHKALLGEKGEVPDDEHVTEMGRAAVRREGDDLTIVALAAMVGVALDAAGRLAEEGVSAEVIDLRTLVPLDITTVLESFEKTSRLLIVEENPRQGGWGGEVASLVMERGFWSLDAPITRVAGESVPLPTAKNLETAVLPNVDRVTQKALELARF